jgi:hypothetical protein
MQKNFGGRYQSIELDKSGPDFYTLTFSIMPGMTVSVYDLTDADKEALIRELQK